jgi:hypothetical protein
MDFQNVKGLSEGITNIGRQFFDSKNTLTKKTRFLAKSGFKQIYIENLIFSSQK